MEEKIDDETLDSAMETQKENHSEESITKQDIVNNKPIQEATTMEVHHHAYHEGKKNWKSYFWEFAMLFLAVFCGFLAEYQLEHTIEKDRAKEFAISLVKELQNDITALEEHKKTRDLFCRATDSLLKINAIRISPSSPTIKDSF